MANKSLLVFKAQARISPEYHDLVLARLQPIAEKLNTEVVVVDFGNDIQLQPDLSQLVEAVNRQADAVMQLASAVADIAVEGEEDGPGHYMDGSCIG